MRDQAIYESALRAAGKSKGTIEQRLGDLIRFEVCTKIDPSDATFENLRSYLADGAQRWAAQYMKRIRGTFRNYFGWLHAEGCRDENPALGLPPITVPRDAGKRAPAPEEVVFKAVHRAPNLAIRLIIVLAASLGLRRSEIAALRLRDREGALLYVTGKGGHRRKIPLEPYSLTLLQEREKEVGFHEYYFPGRYTGHLHPSTIASWARPFLRGHCLHSLRHRTASSGFKKTKDIRAVQDLLGHASLATTQIYVGTDFEAIAAVTAATSLSRQSQPPPAPAPLSRDLSDLDEHGLLEAHARLHEALKRYGWASSLQHSTALTLF